MLSQLGKSLGMLRWREALLSDRQKAPPDEGPEPLSVAVELMNLTSVHTTTRSFQILGEQ
jgi:hypothetical protein